MRVRFRAVVCRLEEMREDNSGRRASRSDKGGLDRSREAVVGEMGDVVERRCGRVVRRSMSEGGGGVVVRVVVRMCCLADFRR